MAREGSYGKSRVRDGKGRDMERGGRDGKARGGW